MVKNPESRELQIETDVYVSVLEEDPENEGKDVNSTQDNKAVGAILKEVLVHYLGHQKKKHKHDKPITDIFCRSDQAGIFANIPTSRYFCKVQFTPLKGVNFKTLKKF